MWDIPNNRIGEWGVYKDKGILNLYQKSTEWMTTGILEHETYKPLLKKAKGDVLIGGLGLGYGLWLLKDKPEITSITVIENSPEVINLVSPYIKTKISLIEEDFYKYLNKTESKFDFIWIDIFTMDPSHFPEDIVLLNNFAPKCLKENGEILYWGVGEYGN